MRKRKGYLGIDIGTHSIKMAQVERQADRIKLVDAVLVPRKQPWASSGWCQSEAMTSTTEIHSAKSMGDHFFGRHAMATPSMALCDIRTMEVPQGSPHSELEFIRKRFADVERFDINSRQFDYWRFKQDWSRASAEDTYVLSIDRTWAEQIVIDHRKSRLKCLALDGIPNSLARAAEMYYPSKSRTPSAILDWGFTRVTFCLQSEGTPVFVRILRESGLQRAIDMITNALPISQSEAQELLLEFGFSNGRKPKLPVQQTITEILASYFSGVLAELNRTLDYLRLEKIADTPSQLILFGGGATINNISEWLQRNVAIDVSKWNLEDSPDNLDCPIELFGPAIALSSLAWE